MCDNIEQHKQKNIDNIRTGCCIELLSLLDSFFSDFDRLSQCIDDFSEFFNSQSVSTLKDQVSDIRNLLTDNIDIILNDIDKSEKYCNYMIRYF